MNSTPVGPAILAAAVLLLAGCADQKIHVYTVPKEPKLALAEDGHFHAPDEQPGHSHAEAHLHWELPAGWKEEAPSGMRRASFSILEEGKTAEVAVIPLPGTTGIELESVNIWRKDLGLPDWTREDFDREAKEVTVGGAKGHLVEMVASAAAPGREFITRTTGVIVPKEGTLWFIKMTGEDSLVSAHREKFGSFINSLEFHASGADHAPREAVVSSNTDEVPASAGLPKWQAPAHWQPKAPGSMVTAAYSVTTDSGKAEVTISKLGSSFGGLLPNVQRWERQLGLPGSTPADLNKVVSSVTIDGKQLSLVDLTGTDLSTSDPARTIVVIVPSSTETWFYKIMGDPQVVGGEKDNLVKFIEEAH